MGCSCREVDDGVADGFVGTLWKEMDLKEKRFLVGV